MRSKCHCSNPVDPIPVGPALTWKDRARHWGYRWGVGRMKAAVPPGLYQIGCPDRTTPVLVTANYRMSFDLLRASLAGRNAWVLVLDTKGINVWCAAGKGTFGTEEVVKRLQAVRLGEQVDHRRLILPQLAAPGVAAHAVQAQTGFRVEYGPIRCQELPAYLDRGEASAAMRRVSFTLWERLAVVPMEWRPAFLPLAIAAVGIGFLLGWVPAVGFFGITLSAPLAVAGLHDWIPGHWLSIKGAVWGAALGLAFAAAAGLDLDAGLSLLTASSAVSAYLGLNLTGSTPYTSVNGVRREMRLTLPWMGAGALIGLLGMIAARWRF